MSMFETCPHCGANLDPGEKCDCQEQVTDIMQNEELINLVYFFAKRKPSRYEIEAAYPSAKRKLDDLINRFGDDNGQRRKPRYLAQLIVEQMRSQRAAVMCSVVSELQKENSQHRSFSMC
ncbi:MAG: hypothetical protein IJ731_06820 [Eubacterium sp.]|nr:hypothetical protein [Eubacterium sp.]